MKKLYGRTASNIPEIPTPTSNHREILIFMDHQKKEPPSSIPKGAETTPTVPLAGGGGGASVGHHREVQADCLHALGANS